MILGVASVALLIGLTAPSADSIDAKRLASHNVVCGPSFLVGLD